MSVRKNDMSQWYAHTWRCNSLDQAMTFALGRMFPGSHVLIWPMGGQYLVVSYTSAVVN